MQQTRQPRALCNTDSGVQARLPQKRKNQLTLQNGAHLARRGGGRAEKDGVAHAELSFKKTQRSTRQASQHSIDLKGKLWLNSKIRT